MVSKLGEIVLVEIQTWDLQVVAPIPQPLMSPLLDQGYSVLLDFTLEKIND